MTQAEEHEALVECMAAAQANLDENLAPDNSWGFTLIENSRNAEHRGDCTKECYSCLRCGYINKTNNARSVLAVIAYKAKEWPTQGMTDAWHDVRARNGHITVETGCAALIAASPLVKPEDPK